MSRRIARRSSRLSILAALAVLALGRPCGAAPSDSMENDLGRQLYLKYCSACHGEAGKGDGVVSQLMRPAPPDLTQIAKKENGKFPFYDVIRQIDGRETLRAHGNSNMPVWGEVFQADQGDSPAKQAVARGRAMLIAEYLERIQAK